MLFKCLQSLLYEVSNVLPLLLTVVYHITNVHCTQDRHMYTTSGTLNKSILHRKDHQCENILCITVLRAILTTSEWVNLPLHQYIQSYVHTLKMAESCETSTVSALPTSAYSRIQSRIMLTVFVLVDVEDGKDLSVVRDQSLSHHLSRHHQMLQHLQSGAYHSGVPGVESICSSV